MSDAQPPERDRPVRILHLHSSFSLGGKEARAVRLMNLMRARAHHTILSAVPEALGARDAIDPDIVVDFPQDAPPLYGKPSPGRYRDLVRYMRNFDLVLSYNWGAMDGVMARRLLASRDMPALIHHEDGFNSDEAQNLKPLRNWYRRIGLGRSAALVVPSSALERIALDVWQQPRNRVHRIPNGIETAKFVKKPKADALPGLIKRKGECWVGTLAGLRKVKNLPLLVRAFAGLPDHWQLVIAGEGPERGAIEAEAERLGIPHRVHLPGFVRDPAAVMGLFDIFALSSRSEQFPISVVEVMAAGVAVAAPEVGDIVEMIAPANKPYITPNGDDAALAAAIAALAADPALRAQCGEANRKRAAELYDEQQMIARYRALYSAAMGGKHIG